MSQPLVFRIHIRATTEQVWDAIVNEAVNGRYGYCMPITYDLKPGGALVGRSTAEMIEMGSPEIVTEGEVTDVEPGVRLEHTWRMLFMPDMAAEPKTQVTWLLESVNEAITRVTITHDVAVAPIHAMLVSGDELRGGGGWPYILSDLKSLLETGTALISIPPSAHDKAADD